MSRFSRGARVVFAEEKTTGRVGTVIDIVPRPDRGEEFDQYSVEFSDGEVKTLSEHDGIPDHGIFISPPIEDDVGDTNGVNPRSR